MKHEMFILGGQRRARGDGREARGNDEREKREDLEREQREDYSEKINRQNDNLK